MSIMGEINFFLGLQVKQFSSGVFINQAKYIFDILKKFGTSDCSSISTPMATGNNKIGPDRDGKDVDIKTYRSMIGSLMYLWLVDPILCLLQASVLDINQHEKNHIFWLSSVS